MNDFKKVVTGIQGYNVSPTAPTDGQVLQYNSTNLEYIPTTLVPSSSSTGIKYNVKSISTNYTIEAYTDSVIYVQTDAGAITVTLPTTHVDGDAYIVKDWAGNANQNFLTVNTTDGAAINGVFSIEITNAYEGYTFTWLEGKWNTDTYLPIFASNSVEYSPVTEARFPAVPSSSDLTFRFNTTGQGEITTGGGPMLIKTTSFSGLTLTTDTGSAGGLNGPITLKSGCAAGSGSESAHNVILDASCQNGTNQGSIFLITGQAAWNPDVAIAFDTTNANGDYHSAQLGLNCQQTHFNNIGMCFNQITMVSGTYVVNGGRVKNFDYILSADTTAAAVTVTLPTSPHTGDTYIVKDGSGNAATNNITIDGGTLNVDGATTFVLSANFDKVQVTFDGTKWLTL